MKRKRFTEEQIIGILKEAEAGAQSTDLCRRHAIRPHSALGDVPPQEFEQRTLNRATAPILSS